MLINEINFILKSWHTHLTLTTMFIKQQQLTLNTYITPDCLRNESKLPDFPHKHLESRHTYFRNKTFDVSASRGKNFIQPWIQLKADPQPGSTSWFSGWWSTVAVSPVSRVIKLWPHVTSTAFKLTTSAREFQRIFNFNLLNKPISYLWMLSIATHAYMILLHLHNSFFSTLINKSVPYYRHYSRILHRFLASTPGANISPPLIKSEWRRNSSKAIQSCCRDTFETKTQTVSLDLHQWCQPWLNR